MAENETPPNGETPAKKPTGPAHRKKITFNLKFTLILLATVGVFGIGVHFLHAYQVDRNAVTLLDKSDQALAEGNRSEAIRHLRTYVGFRPQDGEALAKLAKLLDDENKIYEAFVAYQEALRFIVEGDDIRLRTAELAILLARFIQVTRFNDALNILSALREKDQENSYLAVLTARSHAGLKQVPEASREFLLAIKYDPTNIEAYTGLVEVFEIFEESLPVQEDFDESYPDSLVKAFPPRKRDVSETIAENAKKALRQRIDILLNEMVRSAEPKHEAYLHRGRYRLRTDRLELAEADFQDAEELNDTDPEVYISQIELLNARRRELLNENEPDQERLSRQLAQMKLLAELGLELTPPRPVFYVYLADWAQAQGEFQQASDYLDQGHSLAVERTQNGELEKQLSAQQLLQNIEFRQTELLITQAEQQLSSEKKEEFLKKAAKAVERLRLENLQRQVPSEVLSWKLEYLDSQIHLARREWRQALPKLGRVRNAALRTGEIGDQSQFLRQIDSSVARCYNMLGNPDRQIVVWRRALEADPFWKYGRLELARALATAGRVDAAMTEYELLGDIPEAMVEYARLILNRETTKDQGERSWTAINELLDSAEKLRQERSLPRSLQLDMLRVELLWQQGKRDEALEVLAQAAKEHPDSPSIVRVEVNFLLADDKLTQEQKFSKAKQRIDEAEAELGTSLELLFTRLAAVQRATPDNFEDEIHSVLKDAGELESSAKNQVIRQVAATYALLGKADLANTVLNQLETVESNPVLSRVALIEIAVNQGDEKRVSELLTEIRQIEGASGPFGNVISAQQTLRGILGSGEEQKELSDSDRESLRRIREQLKDAREQRPSWLLVLRMLGSVEQILGNEEIALEYYREAISQGDYTKNVVQYVVSALYRAKNYEVADQILQQISKNRPTLITGDLARAAREVAYAQQDYEQATQLSDELLVYSEDWRDYLTASRLRYAQGERGKAVEEPFLIALQKFPKVPEVLLAYVAYLERDERADVAIQELEKGREFLPQEPATLIPLTMGRGYEILNEGDKAEREYKEALKVEPDNYKMHLELASYFIRSRQYEKAEIHLDFLSSPKSEAPEEIQAIVRDWKLEAIALGGTYEDVRKAILAKKKDSKENDGPSTISDLRLQVRFLSGLNTKKDQQELIDVLTELEDRNGLSTGERLLLASLHEKLDHWEEAKRRYEKLLEDESGLTTAMISFADSLIKKNQFEDARKWINRAKATLPDALVINLIETRLITEESNFEAAYEFLENYLQQDHVAQSPKRVIRDLLANNSGRQVLAQFQQQFDKDKQFSSLIYKGMQALQQGEVLDSIRFLTPVIEDDRVQNDIKAFYYRSGSQLFNEMNQYAAAETLWRKALEFADRQQDTIQLVELVARQDKVAEALEICDVKVQGNYPDTLAAQNYIAVLRAGDPEPQHFQHVEAFIAQALQKTPNPRLKRFMADLKDLSGQHDQAVMLYKEVLGENNKDVIALNNLAYISALLGQDLNFSLNSIEAAINITGPIGPLLDTRGVIHLRRKDYEKAIADLRQANDETPSASTLFRLSQSYWESGNKLKAKQVIQQAIEENLSEKSIHPLEVEDYRAYMKLMGLEPVK